MKTRVQNPVCIATTISVYLGLVLVGASPQVLAQTGFSGENHSRILQFASKTNTVLSKLKFRQERDDDKEVFSVLPGSAPAAVVRSRGFGTFIPYVRPRYIQHVTNDQIFTVLTLPRASI